jgi:hypothetical protein
MTNILKGIYGETGVQVFGNLKEGINAPIRTETMAVIGHQPFGMHKALNGDRGFNYATLLRDPVERLVSDLRHLWITAPLMMGMSVDVFLDGQSAATDNVQTRMLVGREWGFGEDRGQVISELDLRQAKFNLAQLFPVVGITERYAESLERFAVYYDWGKVPQVRHENKARNPHDLDVTQANRKRIEEHSVWDRKLYNWALRQYGYETYPGTQGAQPGEFGSRGQANWQS